MQENGRAKLAGLERRTARGGRDSVDHASCGHDDVANAAAGALVEALRAPGGELGFIEYLKGLSDGSIPNPTRPATALERLRASQEKVSEAATICPACGSNLLRKLSGGTEKRCQQCGKQFDLPFKPTAPMSRAEWLRLPGRG